MKDYYKILGVNFKSSHEEIKSAYRQLALKHHPDRNQGDKLSEEKFKEITEAYFILGDQDRKREYDYKYNQFNAQNTNQLSSEKFLILFQNIKSKILTNPINVDKELLFNNINNILLDVNIWHLLMEDKKHINKQIIEEALFCCLFLTESSDLIIRTKLRRLAGRDEILIQKITNSKGTNSSNKQQYTNTTNQRANTSKGNGESTNYRGIILIVIFLLVLAYMGNYNNDSKISNSPDNPNSFKNGELNESFVSDTSIVNSSDSTGVENSLVTPEQKIEQKKIELIQDGWEEASINNGQMPSCYNFIPTKGKINNRLEVNVGGGTDVVVKLMNIATDVCVRYVFINSGSTYEIKNIPEGRYYLKIAYGKNWYSKVEGNQCVGKFLRNPMYEKGEDEMDFNIQYEGDSYSIPSYRLSLDVISTNAMNSFDSQNISENEFNQ